MFILNYILALSIIIISVVKTTDLFVKSDKALTKIESQFVDQTRKMLKSSKNSEKGNISLTAAVLTALLSLLLLFYITKMKIEYREAVYRKDSYLCVHYLNQQSEKYIKQMAFFNWSLRTAYLATTSGIATVEAQAIFKALTLVRNIKHLLYLKNLAVNKYCRLPDSLSYLKNTPFKLFTNKTLITNTDQTTILRQNKWSYTYYKNPEGIRLKKSFCLKSNFQIKNVFMPEVSYTSAEVKTKDLSSLKCLSGPSLSPSS